MKTKVEISDQVLNFVRSLAPEPRRSLRLALRGLEDERGDIKQLEGDLAGWCRLRVTSYRVIFRYEMEEGQRVRLRGAPRVGVRAVRRSDEAPAGRVG
jgi:mRNA-degrading endonuclease RelE of RelBE toxin-antitoxin system